MQNSNSAQQTFQLAKMLLLKYHALHSFHEEQLRYYMTACCPIALTGNLKVFANERKIVFDIKTEKDFYLKDGKVLPRSVCSPWKIRYLWGYKNQVKMAIDNLRTWSRHLLWDDTEVVISFDGKRVYGSDEDFEESNE